MNYPIFKDIDALIELIEQYCRLKHEYGADVSPVVEGLQEDLGAALERIKGLGESDMLSAQEPDSLELIKALRPDVPRKIRDGLPRGNALHDRMAGAVIGRLAGCLLGAPVENWPVEHMRLHARHCHMDYPPANYWEEVQNPYFLQYNTSPRSAFTRGGMHGVPVDDDIAYTILGLLILEKYGAGFTSSDVAATWSERLPIACTAERVALENYRHGIPVDQMAEIDNPYCQWIGADIRSDPWGYACAGWPEKAAELAYRDAYISHRRNGIYGAMFFAATIAASFCADNAVDAIKTGLTEIPKDCRLHRDIEWALQTGGGIRDYREAREAVDQRFGGMSAIHTDNNACLTVFGLMIGKNDYTKVIGEVVAMGMDNDCNAATAGSIVGAIVGKKGIPAYWYEPFDDTVYTYLNGLPRLRLGDLIERFERQVKLLGSAGDKDPAGRGGK